MPLHIRFEGAVDEQPLYNHPRPPCASPNLRGRPRPRRSRRSRARPSSCPTFRRRAALLKARRCNGHARRPRRSPWNEPGRARPFAENRNDKNASRGKRCTRPRQRSRRTGCGPPTTPVFVKGVASRTGRYAPSAGTMDALPGRLHQLVGGVVDIARPARPRAVGLRAPPCSGRQRLLSASPQREAADVQGSRRFRRRPGPRAQQLFPGAGLLPIAFQTIHRFPWRGSATRPVR